jgi:ABC-2 type transport system ATP-binding protein
MTAIRTTGLTKRYDTGFLGRRDVTAVDGVDLVVEEGEVYGFLGPNGAGKSTTIDMLLDYAEPTEGSVELFGTDVHAEPQVVRERVGVLPEGYGLYDRLTARRHLELAIEWQDADDDVDVLLDRVGLDERDASRPVGDYSKGMTQRLALAMALVDEPDMIILDEPSSGLDPNGIRLLREIVREEADRGATVFFSSHILGQVEAVCDRVGILDDGELVAVDTVEGLREAAGAGATLELTLGEAPTADGGPAAVAADVDGVEDVTVRRSQLRVACEQPRAKAAVVSRIVQQGHEVVDVGAEEASLGDVFAAYTNGNAPTAATDDRSSDDDDADRDSRETGPEVVA